LVLIGFRMRIQDHFSKYTAWAMLATASAQVCVPLGHSSLFFFVPKMPFALGRKCYFRN